MESPKRETKYSAEGQRGSKKPAKLGNADQAHQEQSCGDQQADGMAGPLAAAEPAERNHLGRARFCTVSLHLLMILVAKANGKFHTAPRNLPLMTSQLGQ